MIRGVKTKLMSGACFAAIAGASLIGEALAADPAPAKSSGIEEIVVIAEKRKIDLQKAPLSVTAVSSDVLQKSNITDASALNGYVPGLQIANSGGSERIISIRGVGQGTPEEFFTQPGVSFHIDGIYIPNSIALNMGFFDIDRVEVLRGPQGTVFGQSSTGGAINVITQQPSLDKIGGEVRGTFGDYTYLQGYASLNVPLSKEFAVRGAIQRTAHDGYGKATRIPGQPNYELDDADNTHYKLQALWKPTENWTISVEAIRYVDSHNGAALRALTDPSNDRRTLTQDYPARFRLRNDLDALTLAYDFNWATAKLVSSYQKLKHDQSFEADRLDVATNTLLGNPNKFDHVPAWQTETETIMEEFTLTSKPGTKLDWILGGFFTRLRSSQYVVEFAGPGAPPANLPVPPRYSDPSIIFTLPFSFEDLSSVVRTSWAPFFTTTYHITDRLRVDFGARYNDDEFSGQAKSFYGAFGPAASRAYHKGNWTGKASIDYDLAPQNLVYVSFSRGYKPGGVNTNQGALDTPLTFKSETVESIEIGSRNRFFSNHLELNASAFYSFYDNLQYIQEDQVSFGGGIGNVPKSRIWGAEFESRYKGLEDRLELGGNLTLLNGEVVSDHFARDRRLADAAAAAAGFPGNCFFGPCIAIRANSAFNVKGNQPPNLPAVSVRLYASWKQSLGSIGDVTSLVEWLYRSPMKARIFNEAGADDVPSYDQWNLNFRYTPPSDRWNLSASLINVLDKGGVVGRFVDPFSSGVVSNEYIPPRQFLFSFSYKF